MFRLLGRAMRSTSWTSWYDSDTEGISSLVVVCECTISKNLNIKTTSKQVNKFPTLSTHTRGQGWISTQIEECDLPLCVCACAFHASRGPKWESSCASVPHGTRTVCNGGTVCFTLHVMTQRLWVNSKTVIAV